MSTVSAALETTSELLKLINAYVNPSLQKASDNLRTAAKDDMLEYCRAILGSGASACDRLNSSLRVSAPLPELTDDEFAMLRDVKLIVDGSTLAHLYICARQGSYAADLADLISSAGNSGSKSVVSTAVQSATNVVTAVTEATKSGN